MILIGWLGRKTNLGKQFRPSSSDGDKDVYCVWTHGLLVGTHGNFKPNVYSVHIKI